ncbi:hypothetical protein [Limnofasciculus baicalensis]|nr:hypothetical protein [Limnofasciculus baicalensis]
MNRVKIFTNSILSFLLLLPMPIPAQGLDIATGDSILCKNKKLDTYMALSTKEFNIAICFHGESCVYDTAGNEYFYIGQDRKTNNQIFLPANYQILDSNEWTEKWEVFNGNYKYEVFQTKKRGGYSSISVFQNGRKLYSAEATKYIYNCYD